ncbi:MAG: endonuclease domain-containing protein [Candidatus Shapirobacteria bacterium]|jgi:very-short-patch-repair endonuclease
MKRLIELEALNSKRNCIRYRNGLAYMSRQNRTKPTNTEKLMWNQILSRDKTGYRFVRQKPIDRFIVDFYCSKLLLAIEIDGDSHINKKGTDELRDKFLKQIGIETIRFTNEEVVNNIDEVKRKIYDLIPLLSKRG